MRPESCMRDDHHLPNPKSTCSEDRQALPAGRGRVALTLLLAPYPSTVMAAGAMTSGAMALNPRSLTDILQPGLAAVMLVPDNLCFRSTSPGQALSEVAQYLSLGAWVVQDHAMQSFRNSNQDWMHRLAQSQQEVELQAA